MTEQRRFKRVPYANPVQYRLSPGQQPIGSLASDYSVGGIRLRVHEFVPLKTRIFLDLVTPKVQHVEGEVAWIQRVPYGETYQVGVQFTTPNTQISHLNVSSQSSFSRI